ncbi:Uncharacterised protein [uncultured Comamonas sp.]|nr:Uncharacterised protein [uncultured Comamonas sp.]
MIEKLKSNLLALYWMPAWIRVTWKKASGRLFIFRNECNEFLRYLWWVNAASESCSYDVQELLDLAMEEISARQRMGVWTC